MNLFDIQVEKLQAVSVFFNFLTLYLITNQLNVSLIKQTLNWVCNSRALNSVFISCYELLGSFSSLFFWFTKQTHLPVRRIEIQSHHKTVRWNGRKIAERRWLQCVEIENRSTKLITVSIYLTSSSQLFQHTFHSNISSKSTMVTLMLMLFLILSLAPQHYLYAFSIVCLPLQQVFSFVPWYMLPSALLLFIRFSISFCLRAIFFASFFPKLYHSAAL